MDGSPCEIGLVFALGIELRGLLPPLAHRTVQRHSGLQIHRGRIKGRAVVVAHAQPGTRAATHATSLLIRRYRVCWIISAGFAGALSDNLRAGDVFLARTVIDEAGQQLHVDRVAWQLTPARGRSLHTGTLLTVRRVIGTPEERHELALRHGAMACDMETIGVARVCDQEKVPFSSVRVISDSVQDRLPDRLGDVLCQPRFLHRLASAVMVMARHPTRITTMWRLGQQARMASEQLANILPQIVDQIP